MFFRTKGNPRVQDINSERHFATRFHQEVLSVAQLNRTLIYSEFFIISIIISLGLKVFFYTDALSYVNGLLKKILLLSFSLNQLEDSFLFLFKNTLYKFTFSLKLQLKQQKSWINKLSQMISWKQYIEIVT